MADSELRVSKDFECLLRLLPDGWQEKAKELGALRRCRKVPDPERLLQVLLIHLAEGCSLRETSVRARRGGVVDLSDVAIMDRLRGSGEWFRWMNMELMRRWVVRQPASVFGAERKVRVVDGTRVKEPGPTGSSWCMHYAIGLPSLECSEFEVCDKHGNGESFTRFSVHPGDLFIGDRVHLRKYDKQATMAWIQGKLFVAFLVETLILYAEESFFPWGYPICETAETKSLSVEGGAIHASSASKGH